MLGKTVYINGIGCVSPQDTLSNDTFISQLTTYTNFLKCSAVPIRAYIDAAHTRRMSNVIKMGMVAACISLRDAGVETPDAIITGTGMGCIEDTEKFITNIIDSAGEALSPTAFIQSTHNTISAQIALYLKCLGYNNTFVHRGLSFESALTDALLMLYQCKEPISVLVGGIDELTTNSYLITQRIGLWKREQISNSDLLHTATKGTMAGEGASYFTISNTKSEKSFATIRSVKTIYKPANTAVIIEKLNAFLTENGINTNQIDHVLLGVNGDITSDHIYNDIADLVFRDQNLVCFKHLCGEYHSVSSFGLWLAAAMCRHNSLPDIAKLKIRNSAKINNILIYNHYLGINHSFQLVSACQNTQ